MRMWQQIQGIRILESLKINMEVKGLPRFVMEIMLPVLDKEQDQVVKNLL